METPFWPPRSHRWIPKAYEDRARAGEGQTSLRARAQRDPPDFAQISDESDGSELIVPVTVTDHSGTEVAHADITTWVTPAQGCN